MPVAAPETNLTANVDALLDAITDRTKMLFLANPNNPTGGYLPADELRRLREGLPDHVLMVSTPPTPNTSAGTTMCPVQSW